MLLYTRIALTCALLFIAGCSLGVLEFSHSEYDNGLSFDGHEGNIHMMKWENLQDQPGRCPLVVRFKDGSVLDDAQFQSPQLMRRFGAQTGNQGDDMYELGIKKSGLGVYCRYENNALVQVAVAMNYRDPPSHRLAVDGVEILLPMPESEFFELFGEPSKFREGETSW